MMIKATDVRLSKVCKWVGMLMLVGLVGITTGCGSTSKSIGVTPVTAGGGMVNASDEDIVVLQGADRKVIIYPNDQSGISSFAPSSVLIQETNSKSALAQTVTITWQTAALTTYFSGLGVPSSVAFTTHTSPTFTHNNNSITGQKYSQGASSPHYYELANAGSDYYVTKYSFPANDKSYTLFEKKSGNNLNYHALVTSESNTVGTIERFYLGFDGYVFKLADGQPWTFTGTPLMNICSSMGRFELIKDGKTYTLINKITLPATITYLVFQVLNNEGKEIGEAVVSTDMKLSFKVWREGTLTPVNK